MSIVLSILCCLLKVIAILILILIVLLLLFLILPISYRVEGSFYEKKAVCSGKVQWFFLAAKVSYEQKLSFWVRVLGIPIYHSDPEKWSILGRHKKEDVVIKKEEKETIKKEKKPKEEREKEIKKEIKPPVESEEKPNPQDVLDLVWNETEQQNEKEEPKSKKPKKNLRGRIREFFEKIYHKGKSLVTKIKGILTQIQSVKEVFEDEKIGAALLRLKDYAFCGLRYLMPQKIEGDAVFGMEDPADTGKILGWIAMGIPFYGEHLNITPDFTGKALEGHLLVAGRIRRYKILRLLWKIYKDKDLIRQKDRVIRMIGG